MNNPRITSLLLAAGCFAGHLGWAQRAAVMPLTPVVPVVQPASISALLGAPLSMYPSRLAPPIAQEYLTIRHSRPDPIYLLNSRFIVNELGSLNPREIAKVEVYRGADAPAHWRSLTKNGIIAITLKPGTKLKLTSKSLAAIRRQVKVSGVVRFLLDGLPLEDTSLRVAATIAGLDVVGNDGETSINIRLAPPKPSPRPDTPGAVYIRGVASR